MRSSLITLLTVAWTMSVIILISSVSIFIVSDGYESEMLMYKNELATINSLYNHRGDELDKANATIARLMKELTETDIHLNVLYDKILEMEPK